MSGAAIISDRPANTLTMQEAAERCGLRANQFRMKQRQGWVELDGRQLRSIRRNGKRFFPIDAIDRLTVLIQKQQPPPNTLTMQEAADRCSLSVEQFRLRQRHGWIELNMQRLPFIKRKGKPKYYFHTKDVERLAELLQQHPDVRPGWVDEYIYRDGGGDWITGPGAEKRFKIGRQNLINWQEKPCRFNGTKIIKHQSIRRGRRHCGIPRDGEITIYLLEEVSRIAQLYTRSC